MIKQKYTNKIPEKATKLVLLVIAVTLTLSVAILPKVYADQFDEQIRALQQQNAQTRNTVEALEVQASSYEDAIGKLQAQINALQQAINANLAKQADLQKQIAEAQAELDKEKRVLGESIKAMYVEGQISTLEMLASSKDLSEFVDKQQYRNNVQDKIKSTLDKVTALKLQLQGEKEQVEQLLKDQQTQQALIDNNRQQQAQLLAFNEGQQNAYNGQISANQSKIGELRRQQLIENSRFNIGNMRGDAGNGGYPSVWANAPQDSLIDSWGMYNRECVSFTAWKVHQDFISGRNNHDMPYWGGIGNANQWDENAVNWGIPVDSNPAVGSIAVSNGGTWGHVMYVEQVGNINGQPAIYISQYNASLTGQYSEGWRYTTGLVYIHF